MGRTCALTGKSVQFGHNVAHSNRKTNRRFLPNIQSVSFPSEVLGRSVKLKVSTSAVRTVQKKGGIDAFLLKAKDDQLSLAAKRLKRAVRKKVTG